MVKKEKNLLKAAIKGSSRRNTPMASRDNSDDEDAYSVTSDMSDETYLCFSDDEAELAGSDKADPEEGLLSAIDLLDEKRTQTRENNLEKIIRLFRHHYLQEAIEDHQETLFKSLKRCLARGQSTKEKVLAAQAMSLLAITLDPEDEELYEGLQTGMFKVIRDSDVTDIRVAYLFTLTMVCYVSLVDKHDLIELIHDILDVLQEDDETPSPVVAAGLSCVGFLVTGLKIKGETEEIRRIFLKSVDYHYDSLDHTDAMVRIASGENLAIFYELFHTSNIDHQYRYTDDLVGKISLLLNDHARYRNRKERRHQRLAFRDILPTIESNEAPEIKLKFKTKHIFITQWFKIKQLQHFKTILAGGFHIHMEQNEMMSDIFGNDQDWGNGDGTDSPRVVNSANSLINKARAQDKEAARSNRRAYLEDNSGGAYVQDDI